MAHIEDIARNGENLRATLDAMDKSELMAQQIVQQGAVHALETLLSRGCAEQTVQDMLASLRSNMLVIEAVARGKGFARLFAGPDDAPRAPSPAEQFHEAVLAVIGELMHNDPPADSAEGRALVRLADAVEAYERVMYPMGDDAAVAAQQPPAPAAPGVLIPQPVSGQARVDRPDGVYAADLKLPGDAPGPADVRRVVNGYVYYCEPRTGRLLPVISRVVPAPAAPGVAHKGILE